MGRQSPSGEPVPRDGSVPPEALDPSQPLSLYVHVPYCATRCGYCDFNTYTAAELGAAPGASQQAYLAAVTAELDLAKAVVGPRTVTTIFFGGGTPTLLPSPVLAGIVAAIAERFGLAPDAEITTEANPESVTRASLAELRNGGFNRISFGMQSAVPAVLAVLDRRHTPGRTAQAVADARAAGFDNISVDLIYGTPTETGAQWTESLQAAVAAEPNHVSAYALIVEPGTGIERRIRRGDLPAPDDDLLADDYLVADAALDAAGLRWYELSNWSQPEAHCRHNLAYWRSGDWWGIGPGAHSHLGAEGAAVRWWNVSHPTSYSARLAESVSPGQAREVLDAQTRRIERVLLEVRLADGLPLEVLTDAERQRLQQPVERGLLEVTDRVRLTLAGRLLADAIVRDLLD